MKDLLDANEFTQTIENMAAQIDVSQPVVLVGIRTRGVPLAQRIAQAIKADKDRDVDVGVLDITLYRDDLSTIADHPVIKQTEIPVSIEDKVVYLVDDVLYTGRTIRCALDALFDFGRPKAVKLVVMVDRTGRELPIQADVVGLSYDAQEGDNVKVQLNETDGQDAVGVILKK